MQSAALSVAGRGIYAQIDQVRAATRRAWYAHFWRGDQLLVVYDDARFTLPRHDLLAWLPVIDHGSGPGLRRDWLDFPTNDSVGALS
jgi:hypothetical protein